MVVWMDPQGRQVKVQQTGPILVNPEVSVTEPVRTIPLRSVHSTSWQPGLEHVNLKQGDFELPKLPEKGPAILGFGWAKDFEQLIYKTPLTLPSAKGQTLALIPPADAKAQLWAVVYAGKTGSQPPQWLLDSITVSKDGGLVEVAYRHAHTHEVTEDLYPYVAWIPLGKLGASSGPAQTATDSGREGGRRAGMDSRQPERPTGQGTSPPTPATKELAMEITGKPAATQSAALWSKPAKKDGLLVNVILPRLPFQPTDPLQFAVQFKNVSDKPFTLFNANWYWGWISRFKTCGHGGRGGFTRRFWGGNCRCQPIMPSNRARSSRCP